MSLAQTLETDLKDSMKSKDLVKVSTLRMVKAALMNAMIEKKKNELTDAEVQEILQKQVKQRQESYESYTKASRQDLADKEKQELAILQSYLPKPMTDQEIKTLAQETIGKVQAKSRADAGKVMQLLMPLVKGKADGKRVSEIVSSILA